VGIAIILRKDAQKSYFRDSLLHLIQMPGTNRLLLCSGYISEGKYSILNDRLIDAMRRGCSGKGSEVVLIGGRFYGTQAYSWIRRFDRFIQGMQAGGIRVSPFISPKGKWHAKIAMKLKNNIPMAAIIGSSNLTGPAYREGYSGFSHECDVVIWREDASLNRYFSEWILRERNSQNPFSPIEANLNRDSSQPMEGERMDALYHEIMNMDLLESFDIWKKRKNYEQ